MIRILYIEDDPIDTEIVTRILMRSNIKTEIRIATDRAGIIAELTEFKPQLVLSDFNMIGLTGEDALGIVQNTAPETPLIFISGGIGEDRAIQLLKAGAKDYILKDHLGRLPAAIARAMEECRLAREARNMENHLRQSQKMEAVGTLAAGVAHEINNPLTYILSNLESIRDGTAQCLDMPGCKGVECREQITAAIEGVLRIREIVRDLKTFARSDENDAPHPVDLAWIVEHALAMAMSQVRHRIRLKRELARVPAVMGHEGRLGQVILNLVVNASQAMQEDSPEKNLVIVRTAHADDQCVIEVQDNGPGISAENLERIFDPYFTTKPVGVGTGLGLAICRSIVEGCGGKIEVESEPGCGATFRVRLPFASRDAPPREMPQTQQASSRRRLRILVVDDEPSIRRSTCRVLGHSGHETVSASNGADALRILEYDSVFDLILSDLHMPEVTGQRLHEELVKKHPELAGRMVFMTGGAVLSGPRVFLDTVPNRRIEKPFQISDLLRVIESAISDPHGASEEALHE